MLKPVKYRVKDDVAIVTMASPPMNVLTHDVRLSLADVIDRISQRQDVKAVALFGEGKAFSAGLDVREHETAEAAPTVADICDKLENLSVPVVVGIHGQTFSGGVALALAGHYRLAEAGTTMAFPEVRLAIVPNAGVTQRLPRIIGARTSVAMLAEGRAIDVEAARKFGLIDGVVNGSVGVAAIQFCQQLISQNVQPRPTRTTTKGLADSTGFLDQVGAARDGANLSKAATRIIDCIEASILLPFDVGQVFEQEAFADLQADPMAKAQRYFYVAERRVPPWLIGRGENGRREIMEGRGKDAADRLRSAFQAALQFLIESGVPEDKIDAALVGFGFAKSVFGTPATDIHTKVAALVQRRVVGALMAEGARLIEDRFVQRASDVDVLAVLALGFPRGRGGPMYAAQRAGLDRFWLDLNDWVEDDAVWSAGPVVVEAVKSPTGFEAVRPPAVSAG